MIVRIHCPCGQAFGADPLRSGLDVRCPSCDRAHTLPRAPANLADACRPGEASPLPSRANSEEDAETSRRHAWLPSLAALAAVVLVCLAVLWALAVPHQVDQTPPSRVSTTEDASGTGPLSFGDRTGRGLPDEENQPGRGRESEGAPESDDETIESDLEEETQESLEKKHVQADEEAERSQTADDQSQQDHPNEVEEAPRFAIDLTLPDSDSSGARKGRRPDSPGVGKDGSLAARGKGGRAAGREFGATKESEAAVDAGLAWLARQQQADGSWTGPTSVGNGYPLGCTGLAVLAFLGAGHTHSTDGPYKATVRNALNWISTQERGRSGAFAVRRFYEQGIGVWALCEAYAMTKDKRLRGPAQRTSTFIVSQMGPGGGYGYNGAGDDTHVTSFQIMALKSSMLAEMKVPRAAIEKLKAYLNRSIGADGTTGYTSTHIGGKVTGARTSAGLLCRLFLGYGRRHADVLKTAKLIHHTGPRVDDVFYTYNATYCMFHMGGPYWDRWNPPFRDGVVAMQIKDGPQLGSWQGDVVLTALYVMSLEVYYRYLPVYK